MMSYSLLHDAGYLIAAIAALIAVLGVGLLIWSRRIGSIAARFGKMEFDINQINKAVNNVPPGEQTLVERVKVLEQGQLWERGALHKIGLHIGCELPPHPPQWFH